MLLTLFGILAPRTVGAQGNSVPGTSAPDDAAREMQALLSSPDAVAVARFQCATLKPGEPKPGTDSTKAMNVTRKYLSRLTYGINFPVLSALKAVSGAAKGDGGGQQKQEPHSDC